MFKLDLHIQKLGIGASVLFQGALNISYKNKQLVEIFWSTCGASSELPSNV